MVYVDGFALSFLGILSFSTFAIKEGMLLSCPGGLSSQVHNNLSQKPPL